MPGRVNEKVTAIYTAQLVDEAGANISLSALVTLTLTLYDQVSGSILNGRDAQNVLNANNVAVSSTGAVVWSLQPADNAIVNSAIDTELHIALFKGTYAVAGSKSFNHEYSIRVVNLSKVS